MFDDELSYFKEHQEELVSRHNGRVLALQGQEVIGVYDDALTAYLETSKRHPPGSFMIQSCSPGPSAYTVTIATSATW